MKRSNVRGAKGPCHLQRLQHREGKDEMIKASIDLQDLRRRIYVKAKAEPSWRFWGLYVHVCKMETLRAAYAMAKQNEAQGVEALLEQLRDELTGRTERVAAGSGVARKRSNVSVERWGPGNRRGHVRGHRLRPTSRGCRLYGLPCSGDFSPGRGGFLQLLSMSLSPCCRFHPAKVSSRVGQISAVHVAFALRLQARPSGTLTFEATTRSLLLRPGDS